MNQYLKTMGLGLAGKLIDIGVAKLTSPHRTSPQERIEQINKTLETLESAPEVGQHWTTPLVGTPEPQKEAVSAPVATITTQKAGPNPSSAVEPGQYDKYIEIRARELSAKIGEPYEKTLEVLKSPIEVPHYRVLGWIVREEAGTITAEFGLATGITVEPGLPETLRNVYIAHEIGHGESICKKLERGEQVSIGKEFECLAWQEGIPAARELGVLEEYFAHWRREAAYLGCYPPSAGVSQATPTPRAVDDEYCVGCGPNNHLAKAQSHIEEALRLSRGKGGVIPEVVAPRIQDAVAELGGYEDGDIKHMRERATSALKEILDDLAIQTRDLRNFLRYDISGLELGKGKIEDLETAATWIRKLRQLGYYSVMVEVGQKVKAGELGD